MEMFQKDLNFKYNLDNSLFLNENDFFIKDGIFHCKTIKNALIRSIIYKLPVDSIIIVHEKRFIMGKGDYFPFVFNFEFKGDSESFIDFLKEYKNRTFHYLTEKDIVLPPLLNKEEILKIENDINFDEYEKDLNKKED